LNRVVSLIKSNIQHTYKEIEKMSSTRDIRNFYKTSTNDKIPSFVTSASGSLNQPELCAISVTVMR
jgi:hypothetical protein